MATWVLSGNLLLMPHGGTILKATDMRITKGSGLKLGWADCHREFVGPTCTSFGVRTSLQLPSNLQ